MRCWFYRSRNEVVLKTKKAYQKGRHVKKAMHYCRRFSLLQRNETREEPQLV